MQIPSLNIIGAGRLGQTLGRLFHINHCFRINGICNSSTVSAQKALDFIGAGLVCDTLDQLPEADVVMISTRDAMIETIACTLKNIPTIQQSKLVFHCSGVTPSAALSSLKQNAIALASVHPNMTFASAKASVDHFTGTYCAFEGEDAAFALLENVFSKIGGRMFQVAADKKTIYHAASVMSCNQLIALMDIAVELYQQAGITREIALAIMQPIVSKTILNVVNVDTTEALTGPIARGDVRTIQQHIDALHNPYIKGIYKSLGLRLIKLALDKGNAGQKQLNEIEKILNS